MIHKKKKNSSKVNLTISTIVHAALIGALVFFAAKEGLLGKKLKQLTVTMVPKEKKPEPPKEKLPEPKAEPPKPAESPKTAPQAPKVEQAAAPPPPAGNDAPVAAPPAAIVSGFDFSDGAKANQTISDPNGIYKSMVEHSLKSHWDRDEGVDDSQFAAEVQISVDSKGRLTDAKWLSLSGNARWDAAVKAAVAQTKALSREPPKGFPPKFIVRFDVESMKTEAVQLSSSN